MYLGIDLGTSGVKTSADRRRSGDRRLGQRPHRGVAAQSRLVRAGPRRLDQGDRGRRRRTAEKTPEGDGGGQGHRPVRPHARRDDSGRRRRGAAALHPVERHAQLSRKRARLDADPRFRKITGNIVFPGFTAPKLVWVRNNEPEDFCKGPKNPAAQGLSAPVADRRAYFGNVGSGRHLLARHRQAQMVDTAAGGHASARRAHAGAGRGHRSRPASCATNSPPRWGLGQGITVAGGAGDNAASACGMGTVKAGHAFVSLGTSGVLFAANDSYLPNPESAVHAFCHALPERLAPDGRHPVGHGLRSTGCPRSPAASAADLTTDLGEGLRKPRPV